MDYYLPQTQISDPGQYAHLFDALPDDIDSLCRAVRNIYVHYLSNGYPEAHKSDVDLRHIEKILARVMERDDRPLTEKRPLEKRFVGCCRDADGCLAVTS